MTHGPPPNPDGIARDQPTGTDSIAGGLALVLGMLGLLVAASYPVYAAAFVAALAATAVLVRTGLPALGRRLRGRVTELDVPGFGTVQIRVTAR
ncbi:hypothetical protein [Halopiger djelfimassiliensis]|uniref:hypothetical protein n=1 Tax=Halopiger djelfimassiliensis TaxID=1293047 RepID=UPI0006780A46|nr:hypothetical protein [Halopiger djelfimassiliensis]